MVFCSFHSFGYSKFWFFLLFFLTWLHFYIIMIVIMIMMISIFWFILHANYLYLMAFFFILSVFWCFYCCYFCLFIIVYRWSKCYLIYCSCDCLILEIQFKICEEKTEIFFQFIQVLLVDYRSIDFFSGLNFDSIIRFGFFFVHLSFLKALVGWLWKCCFTMSVCDKCPMIVTHTHILVLSTNNSPTIQILITLSSTTTTSTLTLSSMRKIICFTSIYYGKCLKVFGRQQKLLFSNVMGCRPKFYFVSKFFFHPITHYTHIQCTSSISKVQEWENIFEWKF